jgi:hypothetical protein
VIALVQRCCWLTTTCLAVLLSVATQAQAQRDPHIGYVYPAGGQVGTNFEVTVGGQYLTSITNAFVSGTGVQAIVLPYEPVINFKQAMELRDRLTEIRKKGNLAEFAK